jgi:hypothetical protein
VNFAPYPAIPAFNIPGVEGVAAYALYAQTMIYMFGLMHYYVDSFIWKVRDKQTQTGL